MRRFSTTRAWRRLRPRHLACWAGLCALAMVVPAVVVPSAHAAMAVDAVSLRVDQSVAGDAIWNPDSGLLHGRASGNGPVTFDQVEFGRAAPVADDGCGTSAAGDVNGDGRSDLLVGCGGADLPGASGAGVALLFESAPGGGFTPATELARSGPIASDWCGGESVALGDLDGNGLEDVVIGCARADAGGVVDAALALVFLRRPTNDGFQPAVELVRPGATATDPCNYVTVGAHDINDDGLGDVQMSCESGDVSGIVNAGSVYVFERRSTNDGFQPGIMLSRSFPVAGDGCGDSLARGDLDGDARTDLIVGCASTDKPSATADGGGALVFRRNASNSGFLPAEELFAPAPVANDRCGVYVDIADVNGDRRGDALMGCLYHDAPGALDAGAVFVFERTPGNDGFASPLLVAGPSPAAGDGCGAVVAGDISLDGRADVAAFCGGRDPSGMTNAGSAQVFTRSAGNSSFDLPVEVARAAAAAAAGDACGGGNAAPGDFDGDGRLDLVLPCAGADAPGAANAGVALVLLNTTGVSFAGTQYLDTRRVNRTAMLIRRATVGARYDTRGQALGFQLSADGGLHWEQVQPGIEHVFSNPGSDLRVRISFHHVLGATQTPVLSQLSVGYSDVPPPAAPAPPPPTIRVAQALPRYVGGRCRTIRFQVSNMEGAVTMRAWRGGRAVPMSGNGINTCRLREGTAPVKVVATDARGNEAVWTRSILVDRTAPTVRAAARHVMGPAVQYSVSDRGSGARARGGSLRIAQLGSATYRINATDRAGNARTHRLRVTRHLSLSDPRLNSGLRLPRSGGGSFTPGTASMDVVFAFRHDAAPWYGHGALSPPLVRELQWRLKQFGHMSPMTRSSGRLDIATIQAVKRFQRQHGIPAIATVGPSTRAKLDSELLRRASRGTLAR